MNPSGRPPGYQSFVDRAKYLLDKYTIDEIYEIVEDRKRWGKLPVYDGMIMRRISEALTAGGDKPMNSLLDRLLGKPSQYVEQKIEQTVTLTVEERKREAESEAAELLSVVAKKKQEAVVH